LSQARGTFIVVVSAAEDGIQPSQSPTPWLAQMGPSGSTVIGSSLADAGQSARHSDEIKGELPFQARVGDGKNDGAVPRSVSGILSFFSYRIPPPSRLFFFIQGNC